MYVILKKIFFLLVPYRGGGRWWEWDGKSYMWFLSRYFKLTMPEWFEVSVPIHILVV